MFVDVRKKEEREEFIDILFEVVDGIHFKEESNPSLNFTKEDIVNSIYPITIDEKNYEVDYLRTETSAAAAISDGLKFVTPKVALCVLISLQNPEKYDSDFILDDDALWNKLGNKTESDSFLDFDEEDYYQARKYMDLFIRE